MIGELTPNNTKAAPTGGHLNLFNLQEKLHNHIILYEHPSNAKLMQKFNRLNHNRHKKSSLYPPSWNDIDCWDTMIRSWKNITYFKEEKPKSFVIEGIDLISNLKIRASYNKNTNNITSHFPRFEKEIKG